MHAHDDDLRLIMGCFRRQQDWLYPWVTSLYNEPLTTAAIKPLSTSYQMSEL